MWICEKKDELTWGGFVDLGHTWILFKMQLKKVQNQQIEYSTGSSHTNKLILCHSMSVFDGVPALLATITDWSLVVVFHVMLNWIWIVS